MLGKRYETLGAAVLLDVLGAFFGLAARRVKDANLALAGRGVVWDNLEAVRVGEAIEPMTDIVGALGGVLQLALAGAGAEQVAGSPGGDGADDGDLNRAAFLFKAVKLGCQYLKFKMRDILNIRLLRWAIP